MTDFENECCKHFTGLDKPACELNIPYDSVRDSESHPYQWACLHHGARHLCGSFELHSAEEIAEREREVAAIMEKFLAFEQKRSTACPHCGVHVEQLEQVGRCVYSKPCGHRLWQGRIPAAWK